MPSNYVGQRLSFGSALCTVRYIGQVEGAEKEWLGVEWDDPSRGKHNGENKGIRYFHCSSSSNTAASFVRPTRVADQAKSFVEAVHEKYATGVTSQPILTDLSTQIQISGKVVEEVGFDKVRAQLAQLHELKIVLVDLFQVSSAERPGHTIKDTCPKIIELDISRNLFETCAEVIKICGELNNLRRLRLNGNRLQVHPEDLLGAQQVCFSVKELEMDDMLLSWDDIGLIAKQFESLISLSASSNSLRALISPLSNSTLTSLTLEYNNFTSLSDLAPLSDLTSLEKLLLKGNQICRSVFEGQKVLVFGTKLQYVDLSYNDVQTWLFVDELSDIFPGLQSLRLAHNPIYENSSKDDGPEFNVDDSFMLVVARIRGLKSLNFSSITDPERRNAEMFYLSRIAKEIAEVPESEESTVTSKHKRYSELCEIYDKPVVFRKVSNSINPDFLEARLIQFTFHLPLKTQDGHDMSIERKQEIPKGFDVYRVKGVVSRLFDISIRPSQIRLIWETGEFDPVAGYEEVEEDSSDDEELKVTPGDIKSKPDEQEGKWMKREIELEDSTKLVGFFIDGLEARVRIELI